MGTSDRANLIEQFVAVAPEADRESAEFFLEANNWTLTDAITSYFDNGGTAIRRPTIRPDMRFVCDITIGEGEEVPPNVTFEKTWRILNSGEVPWPSSVALAFCQGERMDAPQFTRVPRLQPGEVADISVSLTSPTGLPLFLLVCFVVLSLKLLVSLSYANNTPHSTGAARCVVPPLPHGGHADGESLVPLCFLFPLVLVS